MPKELADSLTSPVVSSAHLAAGASPALSELEFSLTLVATAYHRWMARCAAAAGQQLTPLEVLVLHSIRHRDRPKRLSDITLVLDIEDTHLATYAIRKLETAGLVRAQRAGKEKLLVTTDKGKEFCELYRQIREKLLVGRARDGGPTEAELSEIAERLRILSGSYNQAARAAATL